VQRLDRDLFRLQQASIVLGGVWLLRQASLDVRVRGAPSVCLSRAESNARSNWRGTMSPRFRWRGCWRRNYPIKAKTGEPKKKSHLCNALNAQAVKTDFVCYNWDDHVCYGQGSDTEDNH
jgi:hypothetical protein